jgi:hypothetical protein
MGGAGVPFELDAAAAPDAVDPQVVVVSAGAGHRAGGGAGSARGTVVRGPGFNPAHFFRVPFIRVRHPGHAYHTFATQQIGHDQDCVSPLAGLATGC